MKDKALVRWIRLGKRFMLKSIFLKGFESTQQLRYVNEIKTTAIPVKRVSRSNNKIFPNDSLSKEAENLFEDEPNSMVALRGRD